MQEEKPKRDYVKGQKRMLHARMLDSRDVAALSDRAFRTLIGLILLADENEFSVRWGFHTAVCAEATAANWMS